MALIELATVIADDPAASRRWAAEPLPLTDRLTAVLTARFAALPEPAQAALLLAAVADGPDLSAAATAVSGPGAQTLAPAEQLGLIKIDRTGLRFSHPLVRSAIYHTAPFARRAAAHRELAERPARPARPASLAPGRRGPAPRRTGRRAARGHRDPGAAPRRRGRRGAGPGTRGRTQPRPRRPGPQAGRRRVGRRSHRPGRLGPGSHHPRPRGHRGPGTAADRPPRRRVGAGVLRPALRRAPGAHLRRRRGIARPAGPRLGRARGCGQGRLPLRRARQLPGRKPRSRASGKSGAPVRRPWPARRCRPAPAVDTGVHRPVRQQKRAHPVPAPDQPLSP